ENGFAAQAKGKVTVSDDNGDTHIFTADGAGTYGTLSLDPSTGEWTYTLDNSSPDVQALAKGQVATDTFTVTITDQHGASTQTSVNVTVNGANDAPHDIELSGVVFGPSSGAGDAVADVTVSDVDSTAFTFVVRNPDGSESTSFEVTGSPGAYKLSLISVPVSSLPAFITIMAIDDHGATYTEPFD